MKVSQVRRLIKVTIELESEKELKCLDYLLFCKVDPTNDSIRQGKLYDLNVNYEDVHTFQHKLQDLLDEGDDC